MNNLRDILRMPERGFTQHFGAELQADRKTHIAGPRKERTGRQKEY